MNFLELVNRTKVESARSGGQIGGVAVARGDDKRIVNWVASAWVELQNECDWRWMRKSVEKDILADKQRYPLSDFSITDFRRWVEETDDYYPVVYQLTSPTTIGGLRFYSFERFRRDFIVSPTAPGAPQVWSVDFNDDLLIGPTPEAAWKIKIDYWSDVTRLGNDADTPSMPARFHEVLVWRALMELASFDAAPEVYSRAKSNYDRMHGDLRHEQGPKMGLRGRSLSR